MLWDAGCALLFFIGILHTRSVGCRGFLLLFQAPMVLLLHFQSLSVEANDFHWHLLTFYLYILGLFPRVLLYTFFNLPSPCFLLVNAAQLSLVTTVRSSTAPPFGKWRKMQLLQQNAAQKGLMDSFPAVRVWVYWRHPNVICTCTEYTGCKKSPVVHSLQRSTVGSFVHEKGFICIMSMNSLESPRF